MRGRTLAVLAARAMALALAIAAPAGALGASGKEIYEKTCSLCHATGINNAPRFGNAGDWSPRIAGGTARLYESALKGTAKGMPAKGGNLNLADAEVKAAVDFMVVQVAAAAKKDGAEKPAASKAAPVKKDEARAVTPPAAPAAATETEKPSAPAAAASPSVAPPVASAPAAAGSGDVNAFNRLLRPTGQRNLPPAQDGIHDPGNDGTLALQPPLSAFDKLPRSNAGNRVNWVAALEDKKIQPRWDKTDPKAEPVVMDLNIVREVKGSMPDVVYPHKQHTEWLDCSNCHPAIFIPQKGANQISMAAIMLGQKCGVCHGKVAFPVSECRLCHSKKKDPAATRAAAPAAESAGSKQ
jgi:c(7)-type cytochrome triheme protein